MKKRYLLLGLTSLFALASCGNQENQNNTNTTIIPTESGENPTTQTNTPVDSTDAPVESTDVPVESTDAPIASTDTTATTGDESNEYITPSKNPNLEDHTVYLLGDSTMCIHNDPTYYYNRYGFGTQMFNYFSTNLTFNNLALSGRSSLSFLTDKSGNYNTFKDNIKEGDYAIIGFGHNDEKDEADRFRNAKYSSIEAALADKDSFQYNLLENYVKVAKDKGANPILTTPMVRLDKTNQYTGAIVHDTTTGDYRQAVIDVANYASIPYVDLTEITKTVYQEKGYNEAMYYHAFTAGTSTDEGVTVTPNLNSLDGTHPNIYGAKMIAYEFSQAILNTDSSMKNYVIENQQIPTKENDLVVNPSYKWVKYTCADWKNYSPTAAFKMTTAGMYGSVMGSNGGVKKGWVAKETSTGVFEVGTAEAVGKISSTEFGFALAFKQIEISKNYTLEADIEVKALQDGKTACAKQSGFGLMLRDDAYLPANDKGMLSNCICAGVYATSDSKAVPYFTYSDNQLSEASDSFASPKVGDTIHVKIECGQNPAITVTVGGKTYTNNYPDFKLTSMDTDYYYLGMWATRGVVAEFTNVTYTYTGDLVV